MFPYVPPPCVRVGTQENQALSGHLLRGLRPSRHSHPTGITGIPLLRSEGHPTPAGTVRTALGRAGGNCGLSGLHVQVSQATVANDGLRAALRQVPTDGLGWAVQLGLARLD